LDSVAKEKGSDYNNNNNNNNNTNEKDDDGAINVPKPDTEILLLNELPSVLDKQQQTNQAGQLVADYLYGGGNLDLLLTTLGSLLLREDRNFHSIQMMEAAFRQLYRFHQDDYGDANYVDAEFVNIPVTAVLYLAAHSPTMRSQGRTFQLGIQLYHGKHLFEE
jgi:hypothetical protein